MPEYPAQPPVTHPFFIMNPRSGGGKVGKFDLKRKAEGLGAEVFLMEGPEEVDVAAVARDAVARGADLLGAAGGDGTQALVAEVAAENSIPFVVITAGTRNHFALDLGLDREDPAASPDVRQQRLVRRLRRSRTDAGIPRRQDGHDAGAAPGPAARP
jgi:diacylglycerol kinase family enzyme